MYLNCHSYYSFKYGTMSPEQLLVEAWRNRITCIALTDINNTSGILDFFRLAQTPFKNEQEEFKIDVVAGIDFRNGNEQHFIGLAKNQEGFYGLNKFLTECSLSGDTIIPENIPEFENAFAIYPFTSKYRALHKNEFIGIKISDLNRLQISEWKRHPEKLVLLTPVTFRNKIDFNSHRLLRAIDKNTLLSKLDVSEQAQADEIMMTEEKLETRIPGYRFLIDNTKKLLEQCVIDFEFGKNKNRKYFTGTEKEDYDLLLQLCNDNLSYRYPHQTEKITERFKKEIGVITTHGFTSYFLINWDIVRYAQQKNYFYVGRGSGANSIVAYLLKITDVDPIDLDLYFERFINPSRTNPPDFDIDFSSDERNEIIKYIFKKHGDDHTALLATYSTFQSNAVVRELGKVFGFPKAEIDSLPERFANNEITDESTRLIFNYSKRLHDFPNHLSIHAGGI